MKIEVRFTAQIKREAGRGSEVLDVHEGCSLEQVLTALNGRYTQGFDRILFDERGQYRETAMLVVNGQQVFFHVPQELKEGDVLTIMSPIAGG
jgi:MoaD family protein